MYGDTFDFQSQHQQWYHKMSDRKISILRKFAVNTFYVKQADIGSLKSLHTLFDKYLGHIWVKFEQNVIIWS